MMLQEVECPWQDEPEFCQPEDRIRMIEKWRNNVKKEKYS